MALHHVDHVWDLHQIVAAAPRAGKKPDCANEFSAPSSDLRSLFQPAVLWPNSPFSGQTPFFWPSPTMGVWLCFNDSFLRKPSPFHTVTQLRLSFFFFNKLFIGLEILFEKKKHHCPSYYSNNIFICLIGFASKSGF